MAPDTFLPLIYFVTGALMLVWGLGLLRRFGHEQLHRVVAFMLFFGGIAPILAGVGLVQPRSDQGEIYLLGDFLDRFSYTWEFFFPTLLLFALVFPRRRAILDRFRALPVLLYLPHVVHLLLILSVRRVSPSRLFDTVEDTAGLLGGRLSALDTVWGLGVSLHALLFPGVNLLMGLTALILLARSEELRRGVALRRQRLLLSLGFALPLMGYLLAEALPIFLGGSPSATLKPHLLAASMILSSAVVAYAAVRHRFLRIRLLARRGVLDVAVSLLLALLYLFLLERFQSLFTAYLGNLGALFEAGLTVFAIILFQPLVSRVEALLDRRFFGHSGDPRREALRRLGARLGDVSEREEVEESLRPVLQDVFHVDTLQLLVWDCPRREGAAPDPEWFVALAGQQELLRLLTEPLRWDEFGHWCERNNLHPPSGARDWEQVLALVDEGACRGLLLMGPREGGGKLRGAEREHLVLLGGQVAAALRNLALLGELLDKRMLEEEMQLAWRIQSGLLPTRKPSLPGLRLHGHSRPSRQVGGDYFDWHETERELFVVIGDVSGKGIPAAMLMATLQASFRSVIRRPRPPGEILGELNQIIYENSPSDRFVTLWLGRLHCGENQLEYASAGHPPPLLTRADGATVPLQEGGIVLGAFPARAFQTHAIPFGQGDRLVCFTDGVSETVNRHGEQFSDRRLAESLARLNGEPDQVVAALLADIAQFSASGEPDDDCTLLVLQGCAPGLATPGEARGAR
ncbi:MAG: PP2C family protein-serine/threonine phosphatase [Candidatus Krumholzibacteriia bacterium]|nr:PP2C family protein-serine/threonine phosphatase [Candidatus Latescibacterota bacterium]MCB9514619.1 PP2C family protein-serine/threonine phosphatase [Candidatus Latescibacterota bacterium]